MEKHPNVISEQAKTYNTKDGDGNSASSQSSNADILPTQHGNVVVKSDTSSELLIARRQSKSSQKKVKQKEKAKRKKSAKKQLTSEARSLIPSNYSAQTNHSSPNPQGNCRTPKACPNQGQAQLLEQDHNSEGCLFTTQLAVPQKETEPADSFEELPTMSWSSSISSPPSLWSQTNPVFRFDQPSMHLVCRFPTCLKVVLSNDPTSTICPCCGIYSFVRYCSIEHMQSDIRRHYCGDNTIYGSSLPECGRMWIPIAIDELSLGNPFGLARPYIPEHASTAGRSFTRNIVERHRQAVYRSTNDAADYFTFDDVDDIASSNDDLSIREAREQIDDLNRVRCTGKVCATVRLPDTDERRAAFNKLLNSSLAFGYAAGTLATGQCDAICDVIVEELKGQNKWDDRMLSRLYVQMAFEFGYKVPESKQWCVREEDEDNLDDAQRDGSTERVEEGA